MSGCRSAGPGVRGPEARTRACLRSPTAYTVGPGSGSRPEPIGQCPVRSQKAREGPPPPPAPPFLLQWAVLHSSSSSALPRQCQSSSRLLWLSDLEASRCCRGISARSAACHKTENPEDTESGRLVLGRYSESQHRDWPGTSPIGWN
jgi:hypothetical protein